MSFKSSASPARRKQFSILGLTMIIVVVPFCLYYFFFVSSQTSYYSNRNFRVLAAIGGHMSRKIDSLAINLVNLAKKVSKDKPKATDEKNAGESKNNAERVKNAASLVPDFKEGKVTYAPLQTSRAETAAPREKRKPDSKHVSPVATPNVNRPATPEPARGIEAVTLSFKEANGSSWAHFEYPSPYSDLPGKFSFTGELKKYFEPFVVRYVINELNEQKERLFDQVLVADQDGKVIFELGASALSVATLDSLLNAKGEKVEFKPNDQSTSLADVQLAGAAYKLFVQPVTLGRSGLSDGKKQEIRWVVCGLTRTDNFRSASFAAPYTVLIFFVFVVLAAVLCWPLLKLKLLGPKDRLRRADLVMTLVSALMGTALMTFIVLDVYLYGSFASTFDGQLNDLSTKIKGNFKKELSAALTQLQDLNEKIKQEGTLNDLDLEDSKQSKSGVESVDESNLKTIGRPDILADPVVGSYPYFNSVTWMDSKGRQRVKWTARKWTTAFLDVSDRPFFKDTKEGKFWKLTDSGLDYRVASVDTKNTGQNVAVITTPAPQESWVSGMDTKLLSLMGTVLPAGYGYAVVDSSGNVLFHSDEVKNLEEQFFVECDNDRWLRAAVLSRLDRHIDTNYLGHGHRMYVSALDGTPWTLIVFVDQQMARTINLEVVTLSIVLYLLFVVTVVGLVSLVCVARIVLFSGRYIPTRGNWVSWLWPVPERAARYERLIYAYAVMALFFAVGLAVGGGPLVACCVLLPLVGGVTWWWVMRDKPHAHAAGDKGAIAESGPEKSETDKPGIINQSSPQEPKSGSAPPHRTRYAIAFAGLLVVVSALPAWGFFLIAHNFELRLAIKREQVSIAKALEKRTELVSRHYSSIKTGIPNDNFIQNRLGPSKSNWDVYDSFLFGTTHPELPRRQSDKDSASKDPASSPLPKETPGVLDWLLLEWRPLYNQSCLESQGLAAVASSDPLWRWSTDPQDNIVLTKDRDGRQNDPSISLSSGLPVLGFPDNRWTWGSLVAAAFLLLMVYGVVRFVARRFFLLDMELPECVDFAQAKASPGSYVLLRSPRTANGNKWDKDRYCVADLREEKVWPELTETLKFTSTAVRVVLDNFEHRMHDPAANLEKLRAIESLLKSGRRVAVVSTVDPLCFSLTPEPGAKAAGDNGKVDNTSGPVRLEGKQNGAADVKIECHSPGPFSVAIEGKQNGAADGNGKAPAVYLPRTDLGAQWTELFANFATVCVSDDSPSGLVKNQSNLGDPLGLKQPLNGVEPSAQQPGVRKDGTLKLDEECDLAEHEERLSEAVEQARPHHQALWMTFSEGQRCTLIHLAQDGMVGPKNKHLRRLAKRGLVICDPPLRLKDESFRRFVISVSREHDIEAWRHQEGGSAWEMLKTPLLVILVSLALFLFVTQKDIYESAISVVSAVTGGIALLFRLLGMFSGRDKGASPIQS